ncbi:FAD/NAD(P)-binding protein [Schlesneria paludicola]|uniref:FAD/NAD(P)-binding protein n=1 Tax=Schlesneria paludicola TaxID=360056 RepID=UPI000299EC29|nr:FAD/NAD(P)-binding protein [Schlesneria paludicola]
MTTCSFTLRSNPWLTDSVQIVDIVNETNGIATYRLMIQGTPAPSAYQFTPGQFNMLYLPGVGESAISMSGDPDQSDGWIHTVRVAGNVTRMLAKLAVGDTLGVRGPFGTGWPLDQLVGNDIIVVAGGLGLAPLRPLIYYLISHRNLFQKIWLICGARDSAGLLYRQELPLWRQKRIDVQLTVDRATPDWSGQIGVVTQLIDRLHLDLPQKTHLVACGPEVMMKYAAASGLRLGLDASRIWVSLERNMQCATGLCGHCQLGPEFICKDGPVLRYDRIHPYLFVEQL